MNFKNELKNISDKEILISIKKIQEILNNMIESYWISLFRKFNTDSIYSHLINNKKNIEQDIFIVFELIKKIKQHNLDTDLFYKQFNLVLKFFFDRNKKEEFNYDFFIEEIILLFEEINNEVEENNKKMYSFDDGIYKKNYLDPFLNKINSTFSSFYFFVKNILFDHLNIKSIKLEIIYEKKEKVLVKLNINQKREFYKLIEKIENFYEEEDYKSAALIIESIYSDYILSNLNISSKDKIVENLKERFPDSFFIISILEKIDEIVKSLMDFRNSLKSLKSKRNIGNKQEYQIDIFNNLSTKEKKKIMRFWIDSIKVVFNFLMIQ